MRVEKDNWLYTKPIAHRGLWDEVIPENSLTSYKAAAEHGYAIETDVYITTDGEVVTFHDDNLLRMTGVDKKIYECSLSELKSYRLNGTEETIPTLREMLAVIENKAPVLIEIKNKDTKVGRLESATNEILLNYKGEFAVQSFNPLSVKWFKDNSPSFIRGQLASNFKDDKDMSALRKKMLTTMWFNHITKPDFVSYHHKFLPNKSVDKYKKRGVLVNAWTIKTQERADELKGYVTNIIFENFIPKE